MSQAVPRPSRAVLVKALAIIDAAVTQEALPPGRRPRRITQPPRVLSPDEVERLVTVGTAGDPLARAFLMTVYGCGLRLSEATHVRVTDIDSPRCQLRVSHPKGGRERLVPLSDNLLTELRAWYRIHRPAQWLFAQGPDQEPICKGTAQNLYYRARRRAGLQAKCGIHGLRHSFATHLIENGVEITVVQKFLGHAYLATTARYLHVRQERLGAIRSPLGLIRTDLSPGASRAAAPTSRPATGAPSAQRR